MCEKIDQAIKKKIHVIVNDEINTYMINITY